MELPLTDEEKKIVRDALWEAGKINEEQDRNIYHYLDIWFVESFWKLISDSDSVRFRNRTIPRPGDFYRDDETKDFYEILAVAMRVKKSGIDVIYKEINSNRVLSCPLSLFMEHEEFPGGGHWYRFVCREDPGWREEDEEALRRLTG